MYTTSVELRGELPRRSKRREEQKLNFRRFLIDFGNANRGTKVPGTVINVELDPDDG